MFESRAVAWAALAVSALAVSLVVPKRVPQEPRQAPEPQPAPAAPETPQRKIELVGTYVATESSVDKVVAPAGWRLGKILVQRDSSVVKGQDLATVSYRSAGVPRRLADRSDAAYAEDLSASLGSALQAHETGLAEAQSAYGRAKKESAAKLEAAKAALQSALEADQGASSEVDAARAARDKAKKLADRNAHALEEGWISRNEATASRVAYEAAQNRLEQAESNQRDAGANGEKSARAAYAKAAKAAEDELAAAERALARAQQSGLAYGGRPISSPIGPSPIMGSISRSMTLKSPGPGSIVSVGAGEILIQKPGALVHYVCNVPQATAKEIRPGMAVKFQTGSGTVVSTEPAKDGSVTVRVACWSGTVGSTAKAWVALLAPR